MIKIGNSASHISIYTCQPKSKEELEKIIKERINKEGPNCDLNDIDTSEITDMTELFYFSDFNGDISNWNTFNVISMEGMFSGCSKLTSVDVSKWDVSNVNDMSWMFFDCISFNKDISNWKINKDCDTTYMFYSCPIKEEFKPKALR